MLFSKQKEAQLPLQRADMGFESRIRASALNLIGAGGASRRRRAGGAKPRSVTVNNPLSAYTDNTEACEEEIGEQHTETEPQSDSVAIVTSATDVGIKEVNDTNTAISAPSSPDLIRRSFSTSDCTTTLLSAKPEWAKGHGESVKAYLGVLKQLHAGKECYEVIDDKAGQPSLSDDIINSISGNTQTTREPSRYTDLQEFITSRKRSSVLAAGGPNLVRKRSRRKIRAEDDASDRADACVLETKALTKADTTHMEVEHEAAEEVTYVSFPSLAEEVDSLN